MQHEGDEETDREGSAGSDKPTADDAQYACDTVNG